MLNEPHSGNLNPFETLSIAWRSIRANVMRSVLTALGVIIGVAAVVALTSLGSSVNSNVTQSLNNLGTNLLTIYGFYPTESSSSLVSDSGWQAPTLNDAEIIRSLSDPRINGVAPTLRTNSHVKAGGNNFRATIIGTWSDYAWVRNSEVEVGSFFSEKDSRSRKHVAVLGYEAADELFPDNDSLGQKIKIKGNSFTVIGVIPDKGASFGSSNDAILIPISTYLQRVSRQESIGQPTVDNVFVQAATANDVYSLQSDLTLLIAQQHRISDPENYHFEIYNQADSLRELNSITTTLTIFLGAIAGISLLVGGIGIMNIMLVSVTERTREIGVRKALGAKPRDILTQFLLEAIVLSVGGGVLGVIIGLSLALGIVPMLNLPPSISITSIIIAFVFSVAVGIFFGFYPAQRAARLDPVDSLRYE